MKKKKIFLIILAILLAIYLIINMLYFMMGLKDKECCLCKEYYQKEKTTSDSIWHIVSAPAVCCECNYNVFEKLSLILNIN